MALTQCSRAQADCSASTELTTGSEEDQAVQDNDIRNQPVTAMFTDRVRPDKIAGYDAWSAGINADVRTFPGSAISLLNSRDLPTCYFAGVAETQL
jgi:hypothetical protein